MTDNVVPFKPKEPGYEGQVCDVCGCAWFVARVVIDQENRITGHSMGKLCAECGTVRNT